MQLTKHFKKSEFGCNCGCGTDHIDKNLVNMLENMRVLKGSPIIITSGVRCIPYNASIGGVDDSAHIFGYAVDILSSDSLTRFTLADIAFKIGFKRIGIAEDFIHLDMDPNKPQNVLWVY